MNFILPARGLRYLGRHPDDDEFLLNLGIMPMDAFPFQRFTSERWDRYISISRYLYGANLVKPSFALLWTAAL